jgi:HlyD family secretion protein
VKTLEAKHAATELPTTDAMHAQSQLQTSDAIQAASELQAFKALESRSSKKRRKRRLRIAIASILVVILAIFAWFTIPLLFAEQQQVTAVTTDVVRRDTFVNTITASGSLAAAEQVTITSEIMGTVSDVKVSEGDSVQKGQLLFVLDNPDLDRQVEAAQRALDATNLSLRAAIQARDDANRQSASAWQNYNDVKAQVDAALALAEAARAAADAARASATGAAAATSQNIPAVTGTEEQSFDEAAAKREIDAAYQAACAADSAVFGAQQQIESVNMQITEAQANLDATKAQLEKRNVTSPISGQVIAQNLERGMDIKTLSDSGRFPMQVADRSKMSVTINVNETDILKLAVGQEATVTFEALPDYVAKAQVKRIAPTAEGSGGLNSGIGMPGTGTVVAYPVQLLIDAPDERLKIGMTASVEIVLQQMKNVLVVNSLAVQILGEDSVVYVQDETGTIEPRVIDVVEDNGSFAVIEGGIKEGDVVVLNNMGSSGMFASAGGYGGGTTVVTRAY